MKKKSSHIKQAILSTVFHGFFYSWTFLILTIPSPLFLLPARYFLWIQKVWGWGTFLALKYLVGIQVTFEGLENVPATPCLVAGRHESALDTIIYATLFQNPAMILKQELLKIPLYGYIIKRYKMIAVDRRAGGAAIKKLIKDARECLSQGRHVVIFPEGTRVLPGKSCALQPGVSVLAKELQVLVVPVATNSGSHWPKHSLLKHSGKVIFQFLPPQKHAGDHKEFLRTLGDVITVSSRQLMKRKEKMSRKKKTPFLKGLLAVGGLFLFLRLGEFLLLLFLAQKSESLLNDYGAFSHKKAHYTFNKTLKPSYRQESPKFLSRNMSGLQICFDDLETQISWVGLKATFMGSQLRLQIPCLKDQYLLSEEVFFSLHHLFSTAFSLSRLTFLHPESDAIRIELKDLDLLHDGDHRWCFALGELSSLPNLPIPLSVSQVEGTLEKPTSSVDDTAQGLEVDLQKATLSLFGGAVVFAEGHLSLGKEFEDIIGCGTLTLLEEGDSIPLSTVATLFLPKGAKLSKDPKTGKPQLRFSYQEGRFLINGQEVEENAPKNHRSCP